MNANNLDIAPMRASFSSSSSSSLNYVDEADKATQLFTNNFRYFNSIFFIDDGHRSTAGKTFAQWSENDYFLSLMTRYQQEHYKDPQQQPYLKGLTSLWSQWYFGLTLSPIMLMHFEYSHPVDADLSLFKVEFHESGRVDKVYYQPRYLDKPLSLLERIENMLDNHVVPVCEKIVSYQQIKDRLIWSNIGYTLYWYINFFRPKIGDESYRLLMDKLYFSAERSDGSYNPLFRTMLMKNNTLQRRTCCQRNKLPGMDDCESCPVETQNAR